MMYYTKKIIKGLKDFNGPQTSFIWHLKYDFPFGLQKLSLNKVLNLKTYYFLPNFWWAARMIF